MPGRNTARLEATSSTAGASLTSVRRRWSRAGSSVPASGSPSPGPHRSTDGRAPDAQPAGRSPGPWRPRKRRHRRRNGPGDAPSARPTWPVAGGSPPTRPRTPRGCAAYSSFARIAVAVVSVMQQVHHGPLTFQMVSRVGCGRSSCALRQAQGPGKITGSGGPREPFDRLRDREGSPEQEVTRVAFDKLRDREKITGAGGRS